MAVSNGDVPVAGTDRFGVVEGHGIDYIPDRERHGTPRELFAVWSASQVNYLFIVIGGTLPLLGLTVAESLAVVVAGNLFWGFVGFLAISGASSGTPSAIVMRAMFGVLGNRVNAALTFWALCIAYEAINLAIASMTGFALMEALGLTAGLPVKLAIVASIAVITLTVSVYGHATIVRLSGVFVLLLTAGMVLLAIFVAPRVDLNAGIGTALHGSAWVAAIASGLTLIAAAPMSWVNGADYARYLPAETPARSIAWWTALGGFVPGVLLGILGVLASTAVDMSNPEAAFRGILPAWFYPLFLLIIVVGSTTTNILTAYTSGLALQAMGVKLRRSLSVFIDGVIATSIACYALFVSNFTSTLTSILSLAVILLGPCIAIYAADIVLRRNRYDGLALNDITPASPFWFDGGYNWGALAAQAVGSLAALACVNTLIFTGPVAAALGGIDLSIPVGMLVAGSIYALHSRTRRSIAPALQGTGST